MTTFSNAANISARLRYDAGYADTMHGIKTFPASGTDRAATVHDWKQLMLTACETCQDKFYVDGVKAALDIIE